MPVLYEGYDECQKCGASFRWVHFEWHRSKLSSGVFHVERIPEKPWAKEFKVIDDTHTEYVVECPRCSFINHFLCDIEK